MSEQRHKLTPAEAAFFQRHQQSLQAAAAMIQRQRQAMDATEAAMRGALQLLVDVQGYRGRVSLSDDCSELVETLPDAMPQQQQLNGLEQESKAVTQ